VGAVVARLREDRLAVWAPVCGRVVVAVRDTGAVAARENESGLAIASGS
jgi:hypothetical protein